MLYLCLVSLCLVGVLGQVEETNFLRPFPKKDNDVPSLNLVAVYHHPSTYMDTLNPRYSPIVKVDMTAKLPAVNLDNLKGLRDVRCAEREIQLTLDSIETIKNTWNIDDGVAMLVNPHWECLGRYHATFLYASNMEIKSANRVSFKVRPLDPSQVIDDFEIVIEPSTQENRDRLLHDQEPERDSTCSNIKSTAAPFSYSFTGQVIRLKKTILDRDANMEIFCKPECRVTGSAALSAYIKGKGGFLDTAAGVFKTGIGSALDLNIGLLMRSRGEVVPGVGVKKTLFQTNLFPFAVPGMFQISKFVDLHSAICQLIINCRGQSSCKHGGKHGSKCQRISPVWLRCDTRFLCRQDGVERRSRYEHVQGYQGQYMHGQIHGPQIYRSPCQYYRVRGLFGERVRHTNYFNARQSLWTTKWGVR